MTLVERVARAIATADIVPVTMMTLAELQAQGYVAMAIAALEADSCRGALLQIAALPPVDAIQALVIARRALLEADNG